MVRPFPGILPSPGVSLCQPSKNTLKIGIHALDTPGSSLYTCRNGAHSEIAITLLNLEFPTQFETKEGKP